MRTLNIKSILLTLVMILTAGSVWGDEVTIGTGTETSNTMPFYSPMDNSSTVEAIYTPEEVGKEGAITAIAYNVSSADDSNSSISASIYMRHKTSATYSSNYDCAPSSELTLVYSGDIAFTEGWNIITLDRPFIYNGSDNLEIVTCSSGMVYNGTWNWFNNYFYCSPVDSKVLSRAGNSPYFYYADITSTEMFNIDSNRPNIKITKNANLYESNGIKYYYDSNGAYVYGYSTLSGAVTILSTIQPGDGNTYNVVGVSGSAFKNCTDVTSVTLPSTITSLETNLFEGCTGLTSVTLPSTVTSLPDYMFNGCTALISCTIPSTVTSLGTNLFEGCTSLTSVTLPSTVTSLPDYMLKGCTALTSCTVPSAVTSLGTGVFEGCTSLTGLTFKATEPATLVSTSILPSSSAIYVPSGSVATYKAATYWSDHADQIVAEGTKTEYDLTGADAVTEENGRSVLERIIGETHLPEVVSLKVEGTINSYDLMVMRNKMVSLKHLDLSKATIKANSYEYYTGYCSQDNTLRYWSLNDNLYSVKLPTSLTKIADNAFSNLKNITEIEIPAGVTEIGNLAFAYMTSLKTIKFDSDSKCKTIGVKAFFNSSALEGISIPGSVNDIGERAFYNCSSLMNLSFEDSEEILTLHNPYYNYENDESDYGCWYSHECFYGSENRDFYICNTTPFRNCPITSLYIGRVISCPDGGYSYWTYPGESGSYGMSCRSRLCAGNTNLQSVEFGMYASVIDDGMFAGCSNLKNVKGIEYIKSIGEGAFYQCTNIESFNITSSITSLGAYTFYECSNLETFTFDDNCQITAIPDYFLYGASKLDKIALPKSTLTIGDYAFYGCELMKECKIASNITSIGDYAFNQCNNLNSVYAYTSDPQQIDQNTFSTYHTATLYVPLPSRTTYYYNTQWSQFLNLVGFDYSTDQVGFNGDFQLYPETDGIYGGKPRADIFAHGSLWIHGNTVQPFGDIHLRAEGGYYGSLIASGNLTADRIYFDINVEKDKWHFFCFPFDIPLANITKDGNYKWAEYDGSVRAANGTTGWKTLPSGTKTLKKGHGYIFRTDYTGDLSLRVENPTFEAVNEQTTLTSYTSTSDANADWNMVGNPYPCYYPINKLEYGAPIIVWNGASYDAYRPGDDDYILHPFEAFFVQKPEAVGYVGFYHESRQTYQSSHPSASQAKISGFQYDDPFEATATASTETARQLINLSLCLGDNCDKTRVVFNAAKAESYERDCDAAKFVTTDTAPQLYSIGSDDTKYAINERPVSNGKVALGFYAPEDGMYTINATRMDVAARIYDAQTAKTYDLADGEFAFNASKGTDNGRFTLILDDTTTGVNAIENGESSVENCYDLGGRKVNNAQNGVYIENGKKVIKK